MVMLVVGCAPTDLAHSPAPTPTDGGFEPSEGPIVSSLPSPLPSDSYEPILTSPETYWDGTQVIDGPTSVEGYVVELVDGDTFVMCISREYSCSVTDETMEVRLVQIDTPEVGTDGECYGEAASLELADLLIEGVPVIAVTDPHLDQVDRYGRMLAWVWSPIELVNLSMVSRGAAAPYFYRGQRGAFADRIESAARGARAANRGLWGACPGTPYDPTSGVATGAAN